MDIKTINYIINGFFLACAIFGAQCECLENKFGFIEKVSFYPEEKNLHVGDTLWITSSFSCQNMVDIKTGDTLSLCEIPDVIKCPIGVTKLEKDSLGAPIGVASEFDYINEQGFIEIGSWIKSNKSFAAITYSKSDETYSFLIGLKLAKTGKFAIGFSSDPGVLLFDKKSDCDTRGDFSFEVTNEDRHKELLYEFYELSAPVYWIEGTGVYSFEVIE